MLGNIIKTIGIIDSGIGGISVLNQLIEKFGCGNYIYLADNLYMPYGNRSKNFVKRRVNDLVDMLLNNYKVDLVVIACNTASSCIKETDKVKILKFDKSKTYFATRLTAKNLIGYKVIGDSNLAHQIEKYIFNLKRLEKTVKQHIERYNQIKESDLVLGCTHYELVKSYFEKNLPNTKISNNSASICKDLKIQSKTLAVVYITTRKSERYCEELRKLTKF